MSLYTTRRTPIPRDEPLHMPAIPRPHMRSTGPVGTTPGPPHPQSQRGGTSPTTPSLVNVSPVHHSPGLRQMEGPPTEVTPFNDPRHVLPRSPLVPIEEHSQVTGFAPLSSSTPYEPLTREPPPRYPTSSPARGMPSTFMEPLSWMIHSRLETPRTPSRLQGPSTFREPYPVANPPTAPAGFVHSPDPRPVSGDSPLVAATRRFTQAEKNYLRTVQPTTSAPSNTPSTPHRLFSATPHQQQSYAPVWPAAQSGPPPLMPPTQPAPPAPVPVPPTPFTPQVAPPAVPPQHFGYAPGGWGPVPNYYPALAQLYPISYPPGPWPPNQQYYTGPQGHSEEDSETAKPDKFT